MAIKKILVAYDFSESSTQALDSAIVLAQTFSAQLELLHVVPYDEVSQLINLIPHLDEVEAHIRRNVEKEFEKVVGARTAQMIQTHIQVGRPAHEIATFAEKGGYDLLMMGTHGHGGVRHFLLGSVAERVLRHAKLPVLISRGNFPVTNLNILVPVDRSPGSGNALRQAKQWVDAFGGKITVIHVLGEYYYFPLYIQADLDAYGGLIGEYETKEKDAIAEWIKSLAWQGPLPEIVFINGADAAHEIVETAKSRHSSLIIMGTHGRSGLEHVILGSVTEKTVRYAPCSVLTVHG